MRRNTKQRIMVVEDDEAHRAALQRHLLRSGFDVAACDSAEQALSGWPSSHRTSYNGYPHGGMSGMDLLKTSGSGYRRADDPGHGV